MSPCHSTDGSRLKREKPELGPLSQEADIERIVSEFGSDSDAKKIQYSINSRIT